VGPILARPFKACLLGASSHAEITSEQIREYGKADCWSLEGLYSRC